MRDRPMSNTHDRIDGTLSNAITGLGSRRERSTHTTIAPLSRFLSQGEQESLYAKSWLCRRVCDLFPSDGTREGWELNLGGDDQQKVDERIKELAAEAEEMNLRTYVAEAAKEARLTGGAALILILEDGSHYSKPVDWGRLDVIAGFHVLNRWEVRPGMDWSGIGTPETYRFDAWGDADAKRLNLEDYSGKDIHASRVVRFEGQRVPRRLRAHFDWWGTSVLDAVLDAYIRWETAVAGASEIVQDYSTVVQKIKGLSRMVAGGHEGAIRKRLEVQHMARSIFNAFLCDDGEELTNFTRSASGIADIIETLKGEITGATNISHTRLWGESPSGLGADGRSEDRAHAMDIRSWQADYLTKPLRQIYGTMMRCKGHTWKGAELPKQWTITYRDIILPTKEETAELMGRLATADSAYVRDGVLQPHEVAQARFGGTELGMGMRLLDRDEDGKIKQEDLGGIGAFGGPEGESNAPGVGSRSGEMQQGAVSGRLGSAGEPPGEAEETGQGEALRDLDGPDGESPPPEEDEEAPRRREDSEDPEPDLSPVGSRNVARIVAELMPTSVRLDGGWHRPETVWSTKTAGVNVVMSAPGVGVVANPYGMSTGMYAAVGVGDSGRWIARHESGSAALILGIQDSMEGDLAPLGISVTPLSTVDLVAIGADTDAYTVETLPGLESGVSRASSDE